MHDGERFIHHIERAGDLATHGIAIRDHHLHFASGAARAEDDFICPTRGEIVIGGALGDLVDAESRGIVSESFIADDGFGFGLRKQILRILVREFGVDEKRRMPAHEDRPEHMGPRRAVA